MVDGNGISHLSPSRFAKEYAELKRQVKSAGLLDRQPLYYMFKFIILLLLLATSIAICIFVKPFGFQLLSLCSVTLAFISLHRP